MFIKVGVSKGRPISLSDCFPIEVEGRDSVKSLENAAIGIVCGDSVPSLSC